jgi:predicted RNA-binding protein YlqC (UPF0109 family)
MRRDRFDRNRGGGGRDGRSDRSDWGGRGRYHGRDERGDYDNAASAPPMKDLVEFIAKGIVDDAAAVNVNESVDRNTIFVELRVAQGEVGRVIGREGKLANAIRTLLRVAGNRSRRRVVLDIGD